MGVPVSVSYGPKQVHKPLHRVFFFNQARCLASIVPNVLLTNYTQKHNIQTNTPLTLPSIHASSANLYKSTGRRPEHPKSAEITIATGPNTSQSFQGDCYGAPISSSGEVVFTTAVTAYPESLTDPSYAGQILVLTQPLIGNYGVPGLQYSNGLASKYESFKIHLRGVIVQNYTWQYTHRQAMQSLGQWCATHNVPLVSGIDTRQLVFLLRNQGSSMGSINVLGSSMVVTPTTAKGELFQVPTVSTPTPVILSSGDKVFKYKVAVMDYGVKHNILRQVLKYKDVQVTLLPWNYPIQNHIHEYDGLVLSNGPGDPIRMTEPVNNIRALLDAQESKLTKTPILGICMGHQVMGLAAGYTSYKLKFGNRGHNQPCINLLTGQCIITSQNHGYALDDSTHPSSQWQTLFRNANDGSNEGIVSKCRTYRSVQFHPEAWGGPTDSMYMFDDFYAQVREAVAKRNAVRSGMTDVTGGNRLEQLQSGQPVFVAYVTAGYPTLESTPQLLLALQEGGTDVIELGVPFTDPLADGHVIQYSSQVALKNNVTIKHCLQMVQDARNIGLTVPVVLMGYFNPILQYGPTKLCQAAKAAQCDGFIIVDLPINEAIKFQALSMQAGLSYIPLITPSTTQDRIKRLVKLADSFVYVVSRLGVTGLQDTGVKNSSLLPAMIETIRQETDLPLAVGFGVHSRDQFVHICQVADGVVIGSKLITVIRHAFDQNMDFVLAAKQFCIEITGTGHSVQPSSTQPTTPNQLAVNNQIVSEPHEPYLMPTNFGEFGGQYVPEVLVTCLTELEQAFVTAKQDPEFWDMFKAEYTYMCRPSPFHLAARLSDKGRIWLKREDLNHTGSHKINNAIGQVLLAKRLGKTRIIAETGAGQHGVATATACAKFGMQCVVYMGAVDCQRQQLNVFRIQLLGATVVPVTSGSQTLKDAINEAMRDWVANLDSTHYLVGSAIGPYPFPQIVRQFQSVIGTECMDQFPKAYKSMFRSDKKYPDAVVACVGGGSNAIGIFAPFVDDPCASHVLLIGAEAAGKGIHTSQHSCTVVNGTTGVLHGTKTLLLQDENGQIANTYSISAGLDYPGVGPEHAYLYKTQRAQYRGVSDAQCLNAFKTLARLEGIIPALETAHAVHTALELANELGPDSDTILCVSGRGDKDVALVMPLMELD